MTLVCIALNKILIEHCYFLLSRNISYIQNVKTLHVLRPVTFSLFKIKLDHYLDITACYARCVCLKTTVHILRDALSIQIKRAASGLYFNSDGFNQKAMFDCDLFRISVII